MSLRPSWNYVQARLQARHGERLEDGGWRALEAVRSLDHFIDRSRATPLGRFSERVNGSMSSHAIERALRSGWREYVAEVASWCVPEWRQAILWCAMFTDLPAIAGLLRGDAPRWLQQDSVFAAFFELAQGATIKSPLDVLLPGPKREATLPARWYAHWRSLWPQGAREHRALVALADTVRAHVARLDLAEQKGTSAGYRRALAQSVARMFRHHCASPTAVFCHLVLAALDLERLRGDLVCRAMFVPVKEAT